MQLYAVIALFDYLSSLIAVIDQSASCRSSTIVLTNLTKCMDNRTNVNGDDAEPRQGFALSFGVLMGESSVGDEDPHEEDDLSNSVVDDEPPRTLPVPLATSGIHDDNAVARRLVPDEECKGEGQRDVPPRVGVLQCGRGQNECWKYLSNESGQHRETQTKCMNCGMWVRHHKKSEKVKAHLNTCKPFLAAFRSEGTTSAITRDALGMGAVLPAPDWIVLDKDQGSGDKKRAGAPPATSSSTSWSTPQVKKKRKAPNTMHNYLIPPMTANEQKTFQDTFAMHYYMTATSFYRLEDVHLIAALKKLRPDVKLPSRRGMSGTHLTKAYKEVKLKVDKWLQQDQFGCLTSDGWSNIKNESVINYMLVSGVVTLFLESTQSEEQSHTAEYLAADIKRVINSTKGKISGVVMDNTAANKKTWKILKEAYPRMFFQGCVAHGLHLLVKDVFAATKVKLGRAVADYPDGYPFAPLLDFAADCKKVVKYFHNHHGPKAMLKKAFHASSLKALVMVAPTRWGSLISMFRSLLDGEEVLYQVVTGRDFVLGTNAQKAERQAIVNIVTMPDFVSLLQKSIEILAPIDAAIVYYQSDQVPVSEVYRTFLSKLPSSISAMKSISDAERAYLLQQVQKRMEFMYGDAHGIAYLLDPRYLGAGMSMEQRLAVEELILAHPRTNTSESNDKPTVEHQQSVFEDYTNFRIAVLAMKRSQTIAWGMLECGRISPLKFWMSDGDSFPSLQQLAKQVFSMVATSAASERNFSAFAFVQTKLRNRLSEAAVEKLVYVRTNNMQFMNQEQSQKNQRENNAEVYNIDESDSNQSESSSHQQQDVVLDLASV